MSKRVSCNIFSFSLIFLFSFFTISSFAQSGDLQNDLKQSIKKFDVVVFSRDALQFAESSRNISLRTAERTFDLQLVPVNLLSPKYRAATTDKIGLHPLEMPEVGTFKGKIAGEENSDVRLTISGGKLLGYFSVGGERFFVEPVRNFSDTAAAADKFVVYRENDLIEREDFQCLSEVSTKLEEGKKYIGAQNIYEFQTFRIVEIATEADYEYVNSSGGAIQANTEILSILNMIQGTYRDELQLSFQVVFQNTWTTADGFNPSNTTTILQSFQNYWNTNFSYIVRDTTHIWSGKQNAQLSGLAYIATACRSSQNAYGLSGKIDFAPNKFVLSAHEISHNLGATHVGAAENCADTIMIPNSNYLTQLSFCQYSRGEISSYVAINGSCLTQANLSPARYDFDGDDKADIGVFRQGGDWYVQKSNSGFTGVSFGQIGDKIVPADFDGDRKTDVSVYRNGDWYRLNSSNNTFVGVNFGAATDIPIPADFDNDDKADINVFRPSNGTWYRINSLTGAFVAIQFGMAGDKPIPADFDGDGRADLNVFRPSNGIWYRINSNSGLFSGTQFGAAEDKPLIGDFDGDGRADISVFRPSAGAWYILQSSNGGFRGLSFGASTDIPVPADYDGDNKTDISVYRPSDGNWYRINSGSNSFTAFTFGAVGDVPIPAFYIQ